MMMAEAGFGPSTSQGPIPLPLPSISPLAVLGSTFQSYIEATGNDVGWEASKRKISEVEEQLHAHSISGPNSISILSQLRAHICWEAMVPDQFIRFYRFMFYVCKEPKRKHVQVDIALAAWQLVLAGRFRLLDRWCEFIRSKRASDVHVISEDQWRQVLDFSRSVHEDLSNFDTNGAWVWLLDDFVEYMKKQRPLRSQCMDLDCDVPAADGMEPDVCSSTRMSPHCGSKRRSPDIDVVAEQLSAMPLSNGCLDQLLKKHCGEGGVTVAVAAASRALPGAVMSSSPCSYEMPQELIQNLAPVQTSNRRTVRTRRSGVSDLVNSIVSDALGFPTL